MTADELRVELGRRLRVMRSLRGLSQAEAAQLVNLGREQLAYIEGADRGMTIDQLVAIGAGFDVPVHILIGPREAWQQYMSKEL